MEHSIPSQLRAIFLSVLLGAVLGVLYDILRPPRRGLGGMAGALLDGAFCLASGAGLFCIAMSSGSGRLGTWELAGAMAGFLLYMHTLSTGFLCIFTYLFQKTEKAWNCMKTKAKKVLKMMIFFFKNQIKCIIMKTRKKTPETEDAQ